MPLSAVVSYPTPPAFSSSFSLGSEAAGQGELISFVSPPGRMAEAEFDDWRLVYNHGERALPLTIGSDGTDRFSAILEPCQSIVMAPFTRVFWEWAGLAQCDVLQVPPPYMRAVLKAAFGHGFKPAASLTHLGISQAGDAISMLRESLKRNRNGVQLIAESLVKVAITQIARGFGEDVISTWQVPSDEGETDLPQGVGFTGLVTHLRAHPCDRLSIAEMEHVSGLRRATLGRRFRSEYDVSPTNFSRRLMSDEACRKLRMKSATLSQIALECGFSDQAHMSRVVKSLTGMTPSQIQ